MANFGFFLNLAYYSPTAEMHLAHILQKKSLNKYDKCIAIICDGKFGGCSANPLNSRFTCKYCISRAKKICTFAKIEYTFLSENYNSNNIFYPKNLIFGAMSTVASHTRAESIKDLNFIWKLIFKKLIKASRKTFNSISTIIRKYKISDIYIYNGRFSCSKAAKEAARYLSINFHVYDVRGQIRPYLHSNTDLHNVQISIDRALKFYKEDPQKSNIVAEKYFFDRRNQKSTFEKSYTQNQRKGHDGNLKKDRQIIVIYTSSDDEYRFLGEDWGIKQQKVLQAEEIKTLISKLPESQFKIIIRIHPNLTGVKNRSLNKIRSFSKYSNVIIHDPDSSVDTYALLNKADGILTFASSIALEASFAGKRLFLIGPSPYSPLNIGHNFTNAENLCLFLKMYNYKLKNIKILNPKKAIMFANFLMRYEDPLPGFKKINQRYSVYNYKIYPSKLHRIICLPEKALLYLTKKPNIFRWQFLKAF